jgi:hypothetical protein
LNLQVTGISGTILKNLIPNYGFPKHGDPKQDAGISCTIDSNLRTFPDSLLSTLLVSPPTSPSTGTIPEEFYSLGALEYLYLQGSKTEGFLPDMIPKLQKLPLLQELELGTGTSGKQSARVIIYGVTFSAMVFPST